MKNLTQTHNIGSLKISVIIPTFNDDTRLQLCLDALSKQTLPTSDYEVIVVNNSKSPLSVKATFENITFLRELKPGSYAARNLGVSAARGEVLAFTDSDCIPSRVWLESGLEAIHENALDRVGGRIELFYQSDKLSSVECYEKIFSFRQDLSVRKGVAVTANLFVARNVFIEIGVFDEKLLSGGDVEWNDRATRAGYTLVFSPEAFVFHPARHSWRELSGKIRRTTGGDFSRDPDYRISILRSIFPPIAATKRIILSNESFRTKVLAFAIAYRIRIARYFYLQFLRMGMASPSRS